MFIAYVEVRFASKKLALRTTREMPKLRGKTRWRLLKSRPVCRNLLGPHLHIGAPVAQLDRAFGYEPKGRKFDSCRAHHFHQCLSAFPSFSNFSLESRTTRRTTSLRDNGIS